MNAAYTPVPVPASRPAPSATRAPAREARTGAPSGGGALLALSAAGAAVQRRAADGTGAVEPALGAAIDGARGGGQALDAATRGPMEAALGQRFAGVRIHADARADALARSLDARAFTSGRDVFFRAGAYAPAAPDGHRVLAHELAHVAQQSRSTHAAAAPLAVGPADGAHEREARRAEGAAEAATSAWSGFSAAPAGLVQRAPAAEPARLKPPAAQDVPFDQVPENTVIADPTGATHGIRVLRRGLDLFYFLPKDPTEHPVPRPLDTSKRPAVRLVITNLHWGGTPVFQSAFSVDMDEPGAKSSFPFNFFSVNVHGLGRLQDFTSFAEGTSASLEVEPGGLEFEQHRDLLSTARPAGARFGKARRYHVGGVSYSMYVFSDRRVQVVEDATSTILWDLPAADLRDFSVTREGVARITWNDPEREKAVEFDLRSRSFSPTGLGTPAASARRDDLLKGLRALGVVVEEQGARFSDTQLEGALDVLGRWTGAKGVVASLRARGAPGLTLRKGVLITSAVYDSTAGRVEIPANLRDADEHERAVIEHEVAHALYHAAGLATKAGKVSKEVSELADDMKFDTAQGDIDPGILGSPLARHRTQGQWEEALSTDIAIDELWESLHHRFPIADLEGTFDIRGFEVADESRYRQTVHGDVAGHGFDNVTEFISSFVTSTRSFQPAMLQAIRASGSVELAGLYEDVWDWVNGHLMKLDGPNPYTALRQQMASPPPPRPEPRRGPNP